MNKEDKDQEIYAVRFFGILVLIVIVLALITVGIVVLLNFGVIQ